MGIPCAVWTKDRLQPQGGSGSSLAARARSSAQRQMCLCENMVTRIISVRLSQSCPLNQRYLLSPTIALWRRLAATVACVWSRWAHWHHSVLVLSWEEVNLQLTLSLCSPLGIFPDSNLTTAYSFAPVKMATRTLTVRSLETSNLSSLFLQDVENNNNNNKVLNQLREVHLAGHLWTAFSFLSSNNKHFRGNRKIKDFPILPTPIKQFLI